MLKHSLVEYQHQDILLEAYKVWDSDWQEPRPAVMVSHAWGGRDDFACRQAERLAALGYVGFALDMYGQNRSGTNAAECQALMLPLMQDRARLQGRICEALEIVRVQSQVDASRVAAIGFCFGGLCVLDLARSGADLQGVVSFHGLLTPPDLTERSPIRASVLVLHGYDDPMARPEALSALQSELTMAGADWQTHAYGGVMHAFTHPKAQEPEAGKRYDPRAERRSWQACTQFLAEVLA